MKTYKPGERVKSKMNGAFTHDEVSTRKRRLFKIAKIKEALIQVKVSVYSKGGIYLIKYSSKNGPRRLLLNMASGVWTQVYVVMEFRIWSVVLKR